MNFMGIENPNNRDTIPADKQEILDRIRQEVEQITDGLDEPVDEGIKDAVVYTKAFGLETEGSCEGHVERDGDSWNHLPYIIFEVPDRPKYIYDGQREIYEDIARENGIAVEDIRREEQYEHLLDLVYERLGAHPQESEEYKAWVLKQAAHFDKVKVILDEFNKNRQVNENIRLIISGDKEGAFRITNNGGVHTDRFRDGFLYSDIDLKEQKDKELAKMVPDFQVEMQAFTEFLKKKFLEQ
ncbi:MAG: hypothetical protein Q8O32_02110 [bacterium]|nr:hypothetical protein [bacterium]